MRTLVMLLARGYLLLVFFIIGSAYLILRHPTWYDRLPVWLVGKRKSDSLYFWQRWTWLVPPANWKSRLILTVCLMVAFAALGANSIYKKPTPWGFVAMVGLMALHFAVYSIRIVARVWSCARQARQSG